MTEPKVLSIVWNLIRGGTEGQCARVAMKMVESGYDHHVAVFRREGFFLEEVEACCGPLHHIPIERFFSMHTWRCVKRLCDYIVSKNIDVVHTWDADASIFGSWAAHKVGIPCITSRRDLGVIYPRYKKMLMHRADQRAVAVVVNASPIAEKLAAQGVSRTKIDCVPNIADVDEFDRLCEAPFEQLLPDGRLVGMVTRLDPEKDGLCFIKAAAVVAKSFQDVSFVVAGDGSERERMISLAATLGIKDRITFLGEITSVPSLLQRLEIGVLVPRSNEGLSNSILEYMMGALPVVATDCGGNTDLVHDGKTGYVVPVGDVKAVAASLIKLLEDPKCCRQMGQEGRQRVVHNFKPEMVVERFKDIYRKVAFDL